MVSAQNCFGYRYPLKQRFRPENVQIIGVGVVAIASSGSVVLLAPAAASMDMFTDYAHRGRAFADAARALAGSAVSRG